LRLWIECRKQTVDPSFPFCLRNRNEARVVSWRTRVKTFAKLNDLLVDERSPIRYPAFFKAFHQCYHGQDVYNQDLNVSHQT
jgi:hypothetical protein